MAKGTALASAAKLAQPAMNTMAMGSDLLGKMAPAASTIGKIPMSGIMNEGMKGVMSNFGKDQGGLLSRLFKGMDKDKMRETGLGMMKEAMQQSQVPPMQLSPFQPGGGGGGQGQGQPPALMQLLQQYGMNKIQ